MNLGPQEILIIALVILVLFGASRIPQFFRGLGRGIREFKEELKKADEESSPSEPREGEGSAPHQPLPPGGGTSGS